MVQDSGNVACRSGHDLIFRGSLWMVSYGYVAALGDVCSEFSCVLWRQCGVYSFKGKDRKPENGGGFDPDEAERNGAWRRQLSYQVFIINMGKMKF